MRARHKLNLIFAKLNLFSNIYFLAGTLVIVCRDRKWIWIVKLMKFHHRIHLYYAERFVWVNAMSIPIRITH